LTQTPTPSGQLLARGLENDADALGLLIVLAKHKKLVLGLPLAAAVVAGLVSLLMPNIYSGTARILPPQQNQSTAAALLGQLGNLGAVTANSLAIKNPSDLYVGILKSRSVADSLIARFQLKELFKAETLDDTRKELEHITRISAGKDGLISIEVEDTDPMRAADIANAYVEELERTNDRLAVTEAAQRRLFFEKELRQQKEALASAEVELKKTQEKTGLIKLDEQGRALIEAVAQVRAQIAAKEVQIGAMRSFTTERNPDRLRAEMELRGLRQQLGQLEHDSGGVLKNSIFVPTAKVPEVGLEYVRKLREVKYQETLFELLAKQYELARLDESKDASIIQVLDRAVPPERKSKPRRALIVILTGFLFGFLAVLLAFARDAYERAQADGARAERLALLTSHLRMLARRAN
jgi:tyrosine-protein kinase Etk/Wzc